MRRVGFTLLELVVSMMAATTLTVALASTIAITSHLLEVPPEKVTETRDRELRDRMAADLRFATSIDDTVPGQFRIAGVDPESGLGQVITYEVNGAGVSRQVDSGPAIRYDSNSARHTFQIDPSAPPAQALPPDRYVRVRSFSTAASAGSVNEQAIDLPPGCRVGDLLILCVASKSPGGMGLSESGWSLMSFQTVNSLSSASAYRMYTDALPSSLSIYVSPSSSVAAAILAVENVSTSSPVDVIGNDTGYGWSFSSATHPSPIEAASYLPGDMNLQLFAGDGTPWYDGTLGIPSFTDAVRVTAGSGPREVSLGVAVRSGAAPLLSQRPRVWQIRSGYWTQTAARIEGLSP